MPDKAIDLIDEAASRLRMEIDSMPQELDEVNREIMQLDIELTEAAKRRLAELGFDPVYGARPLKRIIQRHIQDPLAMKVLTGDFQEGDTILVDVASDDFAFMQAEREREPDMAEVALQPEPF